MPSKVENVPVPPHLVDVPVRRSALAPYLVCPICQGYFRQCVGLKTCGCRYCRICILTYLFYHETSICPVCQVDYTSPSASIGDLPPKGLAEALVNDDRTQALVDCCFPWYYSKELSIKARWERYEPVAAFYVALYDAKIQRDSARLELHQSYTTSGKAEFAKILPLVDSDLNNVKISSHPASFTQNGHIIAGGQIVSWSQIPPGVFVPGFSDFGTHNHQNPNIPPLPTAQSEAERELLRSYRLQMKLKFDFVHSPIPPLVLPKLSSEVKNGLNSHFTSRFYVRNVRNVPAVQISPHSIISRMTTVGGGFGNGLKELPVAVPVDGVVQPAPNSLTLNKLICCQLSPIPPSPPLEDPFICVSADMPVSVLTAHVANIARLPSLPMLLIGPNSLDPAHTLETAVRTRGADFTEIIIQYRC